MCNLPMAMMVVVGMLCSTSLVQAHPYTIRELGFVDAGTRPYRLVMFFDDRTAIQAKLDHFTLAKDLSATNIALVAIALDQRQAHPQYDRLKLPATLTQPVYWLIAPDDRAIAIDPAASKRDLLRSPLRDVLLEDVASSLCAVVLLESSDPLANEKMKAQAEIVLTQINHVRPQLGKVPATDVKLRLLPVSQREDERWTLWSLGEDVAPAKQPKLAVLFGNLRRAGPLLEGTAWDQELFGRIAGLGQVCAAGPDREYFEAAPLLFFAPPAWHEQVAASLPFGPRDDKIKAILQQPPAKRTGPTLSYEALASLIEKKIDEPRVVPDPHKNDNDWVMRPELPAAPVVASVPAVATPQVTALILIAGVVGWALLGVIVFKLERRAPANSD